MKINGLNAGVKLTTRSNILDVKVPKEMEHNIPTGMKQFDLIMAGDGVMPSGVTMVTGLPGGGKSTLMLQLADSITSTGNVVVYNGCEESVIQVRRTTLRLKLKHGFIPTAETDVYRLIFLLETVRKENPGKKVFLIQDSIPTLEVPNYEIDKLGQPIPVGGEEDGFPIWKRQRGRQLSGDNATCRAVEVITSWAKRTYECAFLIGHITKSGDFAGKQTLKHTIDTHLHLEYDTDRRSDTYGERVCSVEKNRFGIAGTCYPFEISDRGVRFLEKTTD